MKLLLPLVCIAVLVLPIAISGKNVVCYFASWTVYRHGNGEFSISDIDTSLCTHIYFAFIGIEPDASIRIIDSNESDDIGQGGFRKLVALKQQNPNLKVLVSMGGWNEGSRNFSIVARDPQLRERLARNILEFIQEYGFDGFDIDWEYPAKRDSDYPDLDPDDFIELLEKLKTVLYPYNKMLTAAVSGAVYTINVSYHVPQVSALLDFINVMAYDYHGHFEPYVGHVAPLYKSPLDVGPENETLNVAAGIARWLELGADPNKINLGMPTYGRAFTLADPTKINLYDPILGGGNPGPYTNQSGFLGYNEICEFHTDWTYYWDDDQKVPHRVSGNQWVGYEDVNSVTLKAEFVKSQGLAGMMVWAFDTDDFRGICGEKYPILHTVNRVLNS